MATLIQLLYLWAILLITTLAVVLWWRPTPEQLRELGLRVREALELALDGARRRLAR